MLSRRCAAVTILSALLIPGASRAEGEPAPPTRPFLMGFTRWPADLTPESVLRAQDFAHAHGDIVSVMFIGGVPWTEALAGTPFSKDVEDNLRYRPPAGTKLFLSISPSTRTARASPRTGARRTTSRCRRPGTGCRSTAPG